MGYVSEYISVSGVYCTNNFHSPPPSHITHHIPSHIINPLSDFWLPIHTCCCSLGEGMYSLYVSSLNINMSIIQEGSLTSSFVTTSSGHETYISFRIILQASTNAKSPRLHFFKFWQNFLNFLTDWLVLYWWYT